MQRREKMMFGLTRMSPHHHPVPPLTLIRVNFLCIELMGKGGKVGFKHSTKRRTSLRDQCSDESDEDYNVGGDEEFDESDDCSFNGDESEVSLGEFLEEEKEMRVGKSSKQKGRKKSSVKKGSVMKAKRRKIISYREKDDDDDYEKNINDNDDGYEKNINDNDDDDDEYEKNINDDDDDDDDDDDEEFNPDEIDYEDDEDEVSVMEKSKDSNLGRHCTREKGFAKGQKQKNSSSKVLKKPMRKKPRNSRRLERISKSKNLVLEDRSKTQIRKKRYKPDSDSDFVSSGPSDYEYTISEEEREQVREAKKVCTSLTRRSSSTSKRLQEEAPPCQQQVKRPLRKGKEKVVIEDLKNGTGKRVCGICLTEEGKKTVRGALNCCDHYFCFACIMEWSKVESRCPLCKQRFVTIGKPARSITSFDLRTVVIHVPERDQVYQPSEEELRGYLDPYETVICTECHEGGDDSLMLLCDVCDSPAHTYCVGLGHQVPEGNWYCEGCRPTAFNSINPQQILSPTSDRRPTNNLSGLSSPHVGIDLNISYVPDTPLTQETGVFSSQAFGSGANTVSERRRIRRSFPNFLDNSDSSRSNGILSPLSSGLRLFGYQLGGEVACPQQCIYTAENATSTSGTEGRLPDVNIPLVHNVDFFPSRLGFNSGRIQTPPNSTSGLNCEQHNPYSSLSIVGTDANASLYACREGASSSRASQGAVHPPF